MFNKDAEKPVALDVPLISKKTSAEIVRGFSNQRWQSDAIKRMANDTVKNVEELIAGRNDIDFKKFLSGIRKERQDAYYKEAVVGRDDARLIGALAASGNWATHDPPIVYLSARLLADKAESGGEIVRQSAVDYGQKVLPNANLYIDALDFLLELPNKKNSWNFIRQVEGLLGEGDIEGAYEIVRKYRADSVRRRGQGSSNNTTSSILTPPTPGI